VPVPQVVPESDDEKRRFEGAGRRRELRQREFSVRKEHETA
jgi:hypothetical protein